MPSIKRNKKYPSINCVYTRLFVLVPYFVDADDDLLTINRIDIHAQRDAQSKEFNFRPGSIYSWYFCHYDSLFNLLSKCLVDKYDDYVAIYRIRSKNKQFNLMKQK